MSKLLKSSVVKVVIAGAMLTSLSLVSCSSKPNAEQLRALEEQEKAATSAEAKCEEMKRERNDLQRQLDAKKAELQAAQKEKDAVTSRLNR